ncbi:MAG: peptide ABC transporter permease [Actinobacteria bacterium 69-20]|nr:ABC transporter permease [Actinomycetota bacterium]OJV24884.1 MAG: peptide ABC transporter permease [Actinobacteria bacterium 69-20]
MATYLLRRLGQSILVVIGVVVLTFVVQRVLPGDPAVAWAGPHASPADLARVRTQLGLDKPLPTQLWRYFAGLAHGDFGVSVHTHQPVAHDLAQAFPASLELVGTGMIIAVVVGIPLGLLAARFLRRGTDTAVRVGTMLGVSMPVFWLALVLQQVFATALGWFPVAGEYSSSLNQTSPLHVYTNITIVDAFFTGNWPIFVSTLQHLVLPALVIAAYPTGVVAQMTRAAVSDELMRDHTRMERALGFSERTILSRFALRPALSPVVSLLALVFAYALVNAFLVESVFSWPGLGTYAVDAIRSVDTPAIAGVTLLIAVIYVVANLVVDLIQAAADPRVRLT